MKALFTFLATMATASLAHMQLQYPPPLRSKYNQFSANIDWDMTSPLEASGSNYPCKGHLTDLGTQAGSSVATWSAGSSQNFTVVGVTTHGGGSCQASLSIDGGMTFKVIHSYIGNCPLASSYPFKVPSDTPTGPALFAWTWFNKIGNREMYMNCASVTIGVGSGTESTAFNSRPDVFSANVGNVGNNCGTSENFDVGFPCPGPDTTENSTAIAPPNCPHKATAIASLGSDTTTNTRRSTAPSSSCKTSIIHSTRAATQSITLKLSLNGTCGGSQTCRGSRFGCCCSKYGYCGITEAHCGEGCNPSFGICNSDAPINPSSSTTAVGLTYSDTAVGTIFGSNSANTLTSAMNTATLSTSTSTKECTLATVTSTIEKVVFQTTTESISTSTSATSIRMTHSSTTTLQSSESSIIYSANSCVPIIGCVYRERGFAEFLGLNAIDCKSKCNKNPRCKAYQHGTDHDGTIRCHLLDADATTSYIPSSENAMAIDACKNYVINDHSCPN
jgi:hypothetical protein